MPGLQVFYHIKMADNTNVNFLTTNINDALILSSSDIGHMLSVDPIHFEDRFCTSKSVG